STCCFGRRWWSRPATCSGASISSSIPISIPSRSRPPCRNRWIDVASPLARRGALAHEAERPRSFCVQLRDRVVAWHSWVVRKSMLLLVLSLAPDFGCPRPAADTEAASDDAAKSKSEPEQVQGSHVGSDDDSDHSATGA